MKSELFKIDIQELIRGATYAVVGGFLYGIGTLMTQEGFNVFTANWQMILNTGINAAVTTFVSYISTKLLTDKNGAFLGKIGGKKE